MCFISPSSLCLIFLFAPFLFGGVSLFSSYINIGRPKTNGVCLGEGFWRRGERLRLVFSLIGVFLVCLNFRWKSVGTRYNANIILGQTYVCNGKPNIPLRNSEVRCHRWRSLLHFFYTHKFEDPTRITCLTLDLLR